MERSTCRSVLRARCRYRWWWEASCVPSKSSPLRPVVGLNDGVRDPGTRKNKGEKQKGPKIDGSSGPDLVEAGGIEPPSADPPPLVLHA